MFAQSLYLGEKVVGRLGDRSGQALMRWRCDHLSFPGVGMRQCALSACASGPIAAMTKNCPHPPVGHPPGVPSRPQAQLVETIGTLHRAGMRVRRAGPADAGLSNA